MDSSSVFSDEQPEKYWTEEQWEKCLLKSEALADQYQKIWKEDPARLSEDPTNLYYKINYGIDLGMDFKNGLAEDAEPLEEERSWPVFGENDEEQTAGSEAIFDELDAIPAYQMAMSLTLDMIETFKQSAQTNDVIDDFISHVLRIASHIAGGHGLGYEEDALCGNIVKNCWALEHAVQAENCLERCPAMISGLKLQGFSAQLHSIQLELKQRICELRAKVWW
jgi:hypothetical protein